MIEYKDSGIEWLGTIPAHWEVKRLKDVTTLNPNYVGGNCVGDVSFVPMESLRLGQIDYQDISFDEAKGKYTFFANEDLLIAKVTPCFENGNIAIAKNLKQGIGFGSSEIFVLRCFDISNNYMFYYSLSSQFQGQACATMCGVGGLKRISPLFMRTYKFAVPPLTEQQAIADYLDKKTAEIDTQISLLENKQKAYEKLKCSLIDKVVTCGLNPDVELKDSGIDWIGEIPVHWEVKRLKSIFSECKEISSTGNEDLLSVSEYYGVARRLDVMDEDEYDTRADSLVGYKICKKDDLVINIMLAWKRGLGFSDYDGIVSPAYAVYRGKNIVPHYYHYLLRTNKYIAEFKRNSKGIIDSRLRLYSDRFFAINTIVPPLEEQLAVADYLDKKTAEIDECISLTDKKIKAYKRLKQSLIDEVVTGKRKI